MVSFVQMSAKKNEHYKPKKLYLCLNLCPECEFFTYPYHKPRRLIPALKG